MHLHQYMPWENWPTQTDNLSTHNTTPATRTYDKRGQRKFNKASYKYTKQERQQREKEQHDNQKQGRAGIATIAARLENLDSSQPLGRITDLSQRHWWEVILWYRSVAKTAPVLHIQHDLIYNMQKNISCQKIVAVPCFD